MRRASYKTPKSSKEIIIVPFDLQNKTKQNKLTQFSQLIQIMEK